MASELSMTLSVISEYLGDLVHNNREIVQAAGIDLEALEVASQCIGDLVANTKSLSLRDKGLNLPAVISAGIKSLTQNEKNSEEDYVEYSPEFLSYMKKLQESGYFDKKGEIDVDSAEYRDRVEKAVQKWQIKFGSPFKKDNIEAVVEEKKIVEVSDDDKMQAELCKSEGNKLMSTGDYDGAVKKYTKAMDLNPLQAIYPANRAAAYMKMSMTNEAIADCQKAIEVNPDYVKAYYRLGNAYEMNGEKNEAIKILKSGLAVAKKLNDADMISAIEKQIQSLQGAPTSAGSPGGLDLNSLLSNPMFGSMAQQMMSNPAMMESMLSGLGGSGGSAPNLDQLKNDPNLHALSEDPEVAAAIADIEANGPSAIMKYVSSPSIMNKVMAAMKKSK